MNTIIKMPQSFIATLADHLLKDSKGEVTIISAAIPPYYHKHTDNLICKLRTRKGLDNVSYYRDPSGAFIVFKINNNPNPNPNPNPNHVKSASGI